MEKEIAYTVYSLPAALMVEHTIEPSMLDDLNKYLDELREDDQKQSAAGDLVGQIHQGEQLTMDPHHDNVSRFTRVVEHLGAAYLRHFVEQTKCSLRAKKVEIDKLWSVHSYEGDYNPIHDHLTTAPMGISFTTWTKVPSQISDKNENQQITYDLYNNSGAIDGYINFTYGLNQTADPERLRPPQSRYVQPEPGKMLMFPSWMQHCVYPFFGPGERRTVAGNLNCFDINQKELQEIKNERV
jgi:hypothetical protein